MEQLYAIISLWGAIYVIYSIALYGLFKKMDISPWIAFVPVLNLWKLSESLWKHGWFVIVFFIPYVNEIMLLALPFIIARAFGKNPWIGIFNVFAVYYVAFSDSEFNGEL